MINEDKKETCHPELVSGSHKIVGLHPTYKYSCHSERRIDLRVSESHVKVGRQLKEEIPEQVRNDMNKHKTLSRISNTQAKLSY